MLRWNPHFHVGCQAEQPKAATRPIILEGGFDKERTFFYIPFSGLQWMTKFFRRRVIKLLVGRELLNEDFARNLHMQVVCPGTSRRFRPGFDALDFLAELTSAAWASNTTTKKWYDQANTFRRNDYGSSVATVCIPLARRGGRNRCRGLRSGHLTRGKPPTDAAASQIIFATGHCRLR